MKYVNTKDVPLPIKVWLVNDTYDGKSDSKYISATQLLKSVKQIVLTKQVNDSEDLEVDIASMVPARVGTAIHDSIEKAWLDMKSDELKEFGVNSKIEINPSEPKEGTIPVYIEQRTIKEFNGYTIGGKFDFVVDGLLHDIKSTSVFTYIYGSHDEDYKLQGSIYKWLNPDIITEDYIRICFVFTDWKEGNVASNDKYPKSRVCYKDIPLYTTAEIESYITHKLDAITKCLDKSEDLIPDCTDEELWLSDPVFKYYSKPDASRASKVFDSKSDAMAYLSVTKQGVGEIREIKGKAKRCMYCPANIICKQKKLYD